MSTPFYDLASLVVVPSGYKSGKVYAQKPMTTDGQLAFTRASSATRVASNGLIEKVRTNILMESNGFSTVSWAKSGTGTGLAPVVTANAGTAPDGTNTASRIVFNCVGSTIADRSILNQSRTRANLTPHASSVFVKAFSAGEVGKQLRFVTELSGAQLIITLTADWQRVVNVGTSTSTSINFLLETRGTVTTNTSADVLLAFAQLETGDIATPYIPTTTAAVSVGPVSGLPRLDYLNSTCPKLLLEPQRSNLFTFSEQFDNAVWQKGDVTVTANAAVSPEGYMNAEKIIPGATLGAHFTYQATTVTAVPHALSFYAKKAGYTGVRVANLATGTGARFNLLTGEIGIISAGVTAAIQSVGNDWYRCSIFFTPTAGSNLYGVYVDQIVNVSSYAGNGTDGIFLWGGQVEAGAYATSYIPTLAASVTRVKDDAQKTGVSSIIGQSAGTIFWDITDLTGTSVSTGNPDFGIRNTAFTNWIGITTSGFNLPFRVSVRPASGSIIDYTANITRAKAAVAWSSAGAVLYVNGVQVATSAVNPNFSFDTIQMLGGIISYKTNQFLLFKTRLTNAQLAELTAL